MTGPPPPRRTRASDIYGIVVLVAGAASILSAPVATYLVPLFVQNEYASTYGYVVSVVISSVFAAMAILRVPRERRGPWMVLLGVMVLSVVAETWLMVLTVQGSEQWPSGADVVFIAGYFLMACGVVRLVRQSDDRPTFGALLDAGIVTTGVGVLALIFVIGPLVADGSQSVLARVVGSLYPLIDVLMAFLLARVLVSSRRQPAVWWIAGGMLCSLVPDTVQNVMVLTSTGTNYPEWMNLLWLLYYASIGCGAVSARNTAVADDGEQPAGAIASTGLTVVRLVVLGLAAAIPAVVEVLLAQLGSPQHSAYLGAGSLLLLVMVLTRIWNLLHQVRDRSEQVALMARTDALTGVSNRRSWDFELDRGIALSRQTGTLLLVALLDLDHFKQYNDERGHQAGDQLLQEVARAWSLGVGPAGRLARWGGEEFAVALHCRDLDDGLRILEGLREQVPFGQTCSMGVARWDGAEDAGALLDRADVALYEAKGSGRDRIVLADAVVTQEVL